MKKLLAALGEEKGHVRFVGGAVRDILLGLEVADVDCAVVHSPDTVIERLEQAGIKAVPTGIDHGTVTAVSNGTVVEVTTLRSDVSTDGRRATVAYTSDWKEDAARRDFTFNALYADPRTGELFDYFGGQEDLEARRVRFIGDAWRRIAEDHLRILRFFRFHARFGEGLPDAEGLDACTKRANDLMALSRERVADELLKLLGLPAPGDTVELMVERGIFRPVLPEVANVTALRELLEFERRASLAPSPLRRLAALLPADPEVGRDIAARLKFSRQQRHHLASILDPASGDARAMAYRDGKEIAIDRIALTPAWSGDREKSIAQIRDWDMPQLPIKGGQLIERGVPKGPEVATILRAIEKDWIEADFPDGPAFEAIVEKRVG
ncbi:CCA tRNA nucleotidyltransferase [Sphingomicrobium lutaoense]|uniref:Poly(A) polymerase n=1 Tax=Sphingomicrobium lutaoense TaxID=515949 RepID=A0A839Z111_9SPHN|nr:CCA tRNA nucleotidyltransferase [Sphingomicrobium lutaoense]MBB3763363.1 poly(A) polymerase [Sphingomicrobium lutaoense]